MDRMTCDKETSTDRPLSGTSIYLDKNKQGLRKKLMTIKKEKSTLEDVISNKNTEIQELKNSVQSLNEIIKSLTGTELKTNSNATQSKINDLNKKNRSLTVELELLRDTNSKLEMKLSKLELNLKKLEDSKRENSQKTLDDTLGDLTAKFNQTKQKLFETLNLNVELKNQLKLAQKCIQQEIGEDVNLNALASAGSSWRGRAQTIMSLQIKINDLKEQLGAARNEGVWPEDSFEEPPIRREHVYHRAEVEILQKDIDKLTVFIDEQNQKIAASKARNKNLSVEISKLKKQCSSAMDEVKNRDNTIEELNEQFKSQKLSYENKLRELQKVVKQAHNDSRNIEFQYEELKVRFENLQTTVANKDTQIWNLNETIKKLEKDLRSICGDFLFDCRDFGKEEFIGMLDSLESERNNLLELNKMINERLEEERIKCQSLSDQVSKQKTKLYRLEAKIRDMEKKQGIQIDKKKRSQRINEYAKSVNTKNSVTSFVFENSSLTDVTSYQSQVVDQFEISDLRNKLEVAHEKISLLEEKLNRLNEEKQNDARTFESIIKSSRSFFTNCNMH